MYVLFLFHALVIPEKLVELIRRDYKSAAFVSLSIVWRWTTAEAIEHFYKITDSYRRKERSQLKEDTVKMTEVFKLHQECDNPRVVLIEGNPGMGKTTYCQKLAHDWSVGEIPPDASDIAFVEMPWHAHKNRLPHDAGKKEKEDFFHFIRLRLNYNWFSMVWMNYVRSCFRAFSPWFKAKSFPIPSSF